MKRIGRLPADARAIVAGDRKALARVISGVENRDETQLGTLRALYSRTGRARVIGITGPLGVGKSSVINDLVKLLRAEGKRVGVVAVDPTSPFSGGSVLGDRIRIERRPDDDGVFMRSMASRGESGGVSAATRDTVRLLDAAGFDVVLVETVGSGQVEVDIRQVASSNVVVVVPQLGDEVQTLKAGLFEIADVFCLNKSDLPGADSAKRDYAELVSLGLTPEGWRPIVVSTSTLTGEGITQLWASIQAHEEFLDRRGVRKERDRLRAQEEIFQLLRDRVARQLEDEVSRAPSFQGEVDRVARREVDPHTAADRLFKKFSMAN